jgi:hypothetical protein
MMKAHTTVSVLGSDAFCVQNAVMGAILFCAFIPIAFPVVFWPVLVVKFIQPVFIEKLLCSRNSGYSSE